MGIPEPDAGRRTPGTPGTPAAPAPVLPSADRDGHSPRSSTAAAAALIVPTLLGLLGFFAVAAAVTSEASTVNVTAPGLLLALTALVVAGVSPLYALGPTRKSLRRPAFLLAACLLVEAFLFAVAPHLVLFTLPALPLALGGGAVLLATSLWGQFRRGPAPEPVLLPRRVEPPRPFTAVLLVVAANWLLFVAGGALCAWLLLGD